MSVGQPSVNKSCGKGVAALQQQSVVVVVALNAPILAPAMSAMLLGLYHRPFSGPMPHPVHGPYQSACHM